MSWLKCFIRNELEELVRIQSRTTKMLRILEIVSFAESLKKVEILHLESKNPKSTL